jgi:ubiquinone/menaquinone biosynthesis C-methylase UbiE
MSLAAVLDTLPLWSAPFGLRILDEAAKQPAARVLDIGSGTGFPAIELAHRFGDGTQVLALDPWLEALHVAKGKMLATEADNAAAVGGVCERLPFRDASFDLIVSNNGLNNVTDLPASLAECARVAMPGCRILFTMNTAGTMREFYDVLRALLAERGWDDAVLHMERHIAAKRPDVTHVCEQFRAAGFGELRVHADGFVLRYRNGSAFLRSHFVRLAFLPSWKALLPESQAEAILADVEARLNDSAAREGSLAMSVPFVLIEGKKR